ncbi:hypothetical protein [Micromonospora globbae]|uniref:hypothetical protein n=1 Tax=Micromonospora globbae TaxID=1894969 RepID=UPI003445FDE6
MPQPEHTHAEHIRRLVDAAPRLSDAQRSRLATILRPIVTRSAPVERREAA